MRMHTYVNTHTHTHIDTLHGGVLVEAYRGRGSFFTTILYYITLLHLMEVYLRKPIEARELLQMQRLRIQCL